MNCFPSRLAFLSSRLKSSTRIRLLNPFSFRNPTKQLPINPAAPVTTIFNFPEFIQSTIYLSGACFCKYTLLGRCQLYRLPGALGAMEKLIRVIPLQRNNQDAGVVIIERLLIGNVIPY